MPRPSTSSLYRRQVKTWMPGTRPGTTITKYQICKRNASTWAEVSTLAWWSGFRPRRIIEKTLAKNLVAAPLLQAHLVDPVHLAGFIRQFEDPVKGDAVTFNHRGERLGIDMAHARQNATFVGDQQVAPDPRGCRILLHAGIPSVIALDGAGMIAGLDNRDKFIQAFS